MNIDIRQRRQLRLIHDSFWKENSKYLHQPQDFMKYLSVREEDYFEELDAIMVSNCEYSARLAQQSEKIERIIQLIKEIT